MALLKNQTGKGYGIAIRLHGVDDLVKTLGRFPTIQKKAFNEAAKTIGKKLEAEAKSNLRQATGRAKKMSVREISDKGREQISKGTFNLREKLSKKEADEQFDRELLERQAAGKSGKPRRKTYKKTQVKISDYALPKKYSTQYFPLAGAIVDNAKTNVYGRTGNLLKSISYKIWSPKGKGNGKKGKDFRRKASGVVYLMVGPTRIEGVAYNVLAGEYQKTNTFAYGHLVDRGHQMVVFGKRMNGFVRGNRFLSSISEGMDTASEVMSTTRAILSRHINGPEFARRSAAKPGRRAA